MGHRCIAFPAAMLGLLLLALCWLAIHPAGALLQCRDAIAQARSR